MTPTLPTPSAAAPAARYAALLRVVRLLTAQRSPTALFRVLARELRQVVAWDGIGLSGEETGALRRLTGGDRARLLAHLEATGPAFAELARRLDIPRPECRAALDEFARAERSAPGQVARTSRPLAIALISEVVPSATMRPRRISTIRSA